jgi:hypothetical protein
MSGRPQRKRRAPIANDDYDSSISDDSNDDDLYFPSTTTITNSKNKKTTKSTGKVGIDLSDVSHRPAILKNLIQFDDNSRKRPIKEGASKYMGTYWSAVHKKWRSQIMVEGRVIVIGNYDDEEEAAIDYARAAFKYKKKKIPTVYGGLDLEGIPNQPLIRNEMSVSGFKGVKKNKRRWEARVTYQGSGRTLGTFDTVIEAATIVAKAEFYVKTLREAQRQRSYGTNKSKGKKQEDDDGNVWV